MDSKLERMRQLMREEEEKKAGNRTNNNGGDRATYPYWNIPEKQTATVRFLPDRDEDNPWFWIEKQTIRLPFEGVVGGDRPTTTPVTVTVPCIDMFGDVCPIIAETRPFWKTDEALARKYWKKRSYIAQGFVLSSPFDEEAPENPIRRFIVGSSLLEKLKAGLRDPEMENVPTDYLNGTDFKIKKTRKGDYNNYDTSEWSRRSRPLAESEQLAIEQYGLWNLSDFKGARPDADGVAMLKAMFHASLNGEPYDMAAFGAYYKPFGAGSNGDTQTTETVVEDFATAKPTGVYQPAGVSQPEDNGADEAKAGPMDLLNKLRERNART